MLFKIVALSVVTPLPVKVWNTLTSDIVNWYPAGSTLVSIR